MVIVFCFSIHLANYQLCEILTRPTAFALIQCHYRLPACEESSIFAERICSPFHLKVLSSRPKSHPQVTQASLSVPLPFEAKRER